MTHMVHDPKRRYWRDPGWVPCSTGCDSRRMHVVTCVHVSGYRPAVFRLNRTVLLPFIHSSLEPPQ